MMPDEDKKECVKPIRNWNEVTDVNKSFFEKMTGVVLDNELRRYVKASDEAFNLVCVLSFFSFFGFSFVLLGELIARFLSNQPFTMLAFFTSIVVAAALLIFSTIVHNLTVFGVFFVREILTDRFVEFKKKAFLIGK